jgi:hypothetical protein
LKIINKLYPHALVILGFVLVSLIYFYPVLQGKQIYQSDIAQYTGMAKEQNDFRAAENVEPYWTNSALGNAHLSIRCSVPIWLHRGNRWLRFYRALLIIYFYTFGVLWFIIGFKTDPLKAFLCFSFWFSTYLIIIIGVGHNLKRMHCLYATRDCRIY